MFVSEPEEVSFQLLAAHFEHHSISQIVTSITALNAALYACYC